MNTIVSQWHRARLLAAHHGFATLARLGVRRAMEPLFSWRSLFFFETDLTQTAGEYSARLPVQIRVASPEELPGLRDLLVRDGSDWSEVETRIACGDSCFVALVGSRVVHFTWLSFRALWLPVLQATLVPSAGEGYISHSYTDPDFRGHGIQLAVGLYILRWEQARGYKRHYYYVHSHNRSGLRITDLTRAQRALRLCRVVRTYRILSLPGRFITGLDSPGRPLLQLSAPLRVRRIGKCLWVRPPRGSPVTETPPD